MHFQTMQISQGIEMETATGIIAMHLVVIHSVMILNNGMIPIMMAMGTIHIPQIITMIAQIRVANQHKIAMVV